MSFPLIYIAVVIMSILVSILILILMLILFLTQANHQTAVACEAAEEKKEIENDNEYDKKRGLMRIPVLVHVLQSLSLILPRKMGKGTAVG
jgi:Na+-transporting methylmalonyl-CoA/oxaloacetate decarboxylase gamma subunit